MKYPFLTLLAFSIAASPLIRAQEAEVAPAAIAEDAVELRSYTRFVETDESAQLETAIARYKNADGIEVDLIGAVHIGDKAYYEKLNELFKTYDVVLYEMVGDPERIEQLTAPVEENVDAPPSEPAEPKPGDPVPADPDDVLPVDEAKQAPEKKPSTHPIMVLQNTMKNMLKLDHQVSQVDYSCKNFVHADMSAKTFDSEKEKKGETFLLMMIRSYKQQFKMMAEGEAAGQVDIFTMLSNMLKYDAATGLKLTFGRALEDTESMIGGLEGEKGSVILTERNKFALGVLRKTLDTTDHKKIAIFYGAAHLPDMDERMLSEFKFERTGLDWLTAWDIKKTPTKK